MPNLRIEINSRRPFGLLNSHSRGSEAGRWLLNALQAAVSGRNPSPAIKWDVNDDTALGATAFSSPAVAALIMASSSGAVGGTIGGTLITVTWATSDTASATALAAAIRASATHNRKVTATNLSMRLTLASVTAGQYVDICGTRFTAVSGTPANVGEFDISGADSADAASLAQAIMRHPSMAGRYVAVSSSGSVYVFPSSDRSGNVSGTKFEAITNTGGFSTVTINQGVLAAGAATAVIAASAGDIGNEVRCTASGTNVTAATNGTAGFLGNGCGGGVAPQFLLP